MEEKVESGPPNGDESVNEKKLHAMERGNPQGPFLGFYSLPKIIRPIVWGYISDSKKDPMKCILLDGQRITLCFSQNLDVELGSCWRFGCLSSEDEWKSSLRAEVDKRYHIKDYRSCLDFLDRENTVYWSITIDVLVFQLDMSSQDISSALDDIEDALKGLEEHLSSVQHVVFEVKNGAFCCFSFNDAIGNTNELRQTVDRLSALTQFLVDLRTCWPVNQTHDTKMLLDHFILSDVKPESDMYRSKFFILLSYRRNRELFNTVDPTLKSSNLKWIYYLETDDDLKHFNHKIANRCFAIHLDISKLGGKNDSMCTLPSFDFCEDIPFIERIVINSDFLWGTTQLPRPRSLLTDSSPRSALIELSLTGDWNTFDLTQLNCGYFRHLAHLSIIGGKMMGRLDSQSVPSLKTLSIEVRGFQDRANTEEISLARELAQSLIDTRRPWQLVASQDQKGWSLASYDAPITNPQDDGKEETLQSSPLIRELLLVIQDPQHAKKCQSRLDGKAPLKATAGNQNDNLLVWSPERVEKITVFSKPGANLQLAFNKAIPGQRRILTSLACHGINVGLHGDALPHLQSLKVKGKRVHLWGRFLELQTLSLYDTIIYLSWRVDAPMLQSLRCRQLVDGNQIVLRPESVPHLSYLLIEPRFGDHTTGPTILFDKNSLGLSPNTHVVFDEGMVHVPRFNQCQIQNVLHLELAVAPYYLPACWKNTEWQCETLTIHFYENAPEYLRKQGITVVKTPPRLSKVKTLTVTSTTCPALLDSEIPELNYCTVPSSESLGKNLRCPKLRCIHYTNQLSPIEKELCLDRAMYVAIGAQPRLIYFDYDGEMTIMSWNDVPSAAGESSSAGLLKENDDSSVPRE